MKKFYFIIPVLASVTIGCNKETAGEDVFGKTVSERKKENTEYFKKILTSAPYGWAIEQYAGGAKAEVGGFTNTVAFDEENVTSRMDMIPPTANYAAISKYSLINNGGTVLSFDEFNSIMHYLARPSSYRKDGQQADFEFLLLSYDETEEIIHIKGKKYGVESRLIKLKEPAANYIEKVHNIYGVVEMYRGLNDLAVNDISIPFTKSNRTLTYTPDSSKSDIKMVPFSFSDTGIHFREPVTINGVTFQDLTLDISANLFKSEDGKVKFYLNHLVPFNFVSELWLVDPANRSPLFVDTFNRVKDANSQKYTSPQETLDPRIEWGRTNDGASGMTLFSRFIEPGTGLDKIHRAVYKFGFKSGRNSDEIVIYANGTGTNWSEYLHLTPMVDLIEEGSPYKYEVISNTEVKLTSKNNPALWFVVKK